MDRLLRGGRTRGSARSQHGGRFFAEEMDSPCAEIGFLRGTALLVQIIVCLNHIADRNTVPSAERGVTVDLPLRDIRGQRRRIIQLVIIEVSGSRAYFHSEQVGAGAVPVLIGERIRSQRACKRPPCAEIPRLEAAVGLLGLAAGIGLMCGVRNHGNNLQIMIFSCIIRMADFGAPARSRPRTGTVASVGFVPDRQNIFVEKTAGEHARPPLEAIWT